MALSSQATRYFISSLAPNAARLLDAVRTHWVLDMVCRKDANRSRKDYAAQNLAILHPLALNLLKQESSLKVGVRAKRLRAGMSAIYSRLLLELP